jgi:hypothetical protein
MLESDEKFLLLCNAIDAVAFMIDEEDIVMDSLLRVLLIYMQRCDFDICDAQKFLQKGVNQYRNVMEECEDNG